MTNFDYLKTEERFKPFADACVEAENSISVSPALCALGARKSAELAVKWLYSVDDNLKLPYKDNFSALVYNPSFVDSIGGDILNRLKYIIKLGNLAAHTGKQISYKEAVLALSCLFDFMLFIDYCYGAVYEERSFDESLLAVNQDRRVTAIEFQKLQSELDERTLERQKMAEDMAALRDEMAELRQGNRQKRQFANNYINEDETRKSIIDIDLRAMGWTFKADCLEEYKVEGMPNGTGIGYADYVLFGDNGKPLAVVEAKKTLTDPNAGRHQASLYAGCLEKTTGQRPLIFYTNGYDTWFWDDLNYPERKVYSVFSKRDLQRIIDRRNMLVDFNRLNINPEITDRDYQKIAIQRVCQEFAGKRRKALLVMATGTGKTRTAISLVDVLTQHRWAKNILFLADRTELVKQAKHAFTKHMPNLSTCNLLERGSGKPADRAVFSTYPTIMNAINDETTEDGKKLFTPGHFDLIIVDEAHRSIFKKYRAIFNYFDALVVGLTATPKNDVGHNTYEFFDLEDGMPTYAYEYGQALREGHLVDYHCIEKLFKIRTQGLSYDKLDKKDRERLEDAFDEDDEVPDFISGTEFDSVYFNKETVRRVLTEVMEKGLKVEGGDKLGKTIIFARNHNHAVFIKEQFDELYPQYNGKFAEVIDNKIKYHEDLLTKFKDKNSYPQIAISVDMLDTGIDVPEILNLVLYKQVLSKAKFWQMFGRGTRLCQDLFGPGQDKKEFYIFDYLGNFEFFSQNPKGIDSADTGSLAEKTFALKVRIVRELQDLKYQTDELITFRKKLVGELAKSVDDLNKEQFQVRQHLPYVEKYSNADNYQALEIVETEDIISHLAGLVPPVDEDEAARRLDVLMFRLMLAKTQEEAAAYNNMARRVRQIAAALSQKETIPEVKAAKGMLERIQKDAFWQAASVPQIDEIRAGLRGLMQYLKKEMKTKVINISDDVLFEREGERLTAHSGLEGYYQRASRYVAENADNPVLDKLRNNIRLTPGDWTELERIFWQEVGTQDEYIKEAPQNTPLGKFVRSLTGLSQEAARRAFSAFLDTSVFTEQQIFFVSCIIDWITEYGTLDKADMSSDDFAGSMDVIKAFENNMDDLKKIMDVVANINNNALHTAA